MGDNDPEELAVAAEMVPELAFEVAGVGEKATPHPLVEALVVDEANPPTLITVEGFIGKSNQEGCIRLYLDEEVSRWFDIPKSVVVHIEHLPPEISRFGPSVLWLDRKRKPANGNPQGVFGKFP